MLEIMIPVLFFAAYFCFVCAMAVLCFGVISDREELDRYYPIIMAFGVALFLFAMLCGIFGGILC